MIYGEEIEEISKKVFTFEQIGDIITIRERRYSLVDLTRFKEREMNNPFEKTSLKCLQCNEVCSITKENLKYQETFTTVIGQKLLLSYYDCPKCGTRNFVQIDDGETIVKLREVKKLFVKLAAKKAKNMSIPKDWKKKFENGRIDLAKSRRILVDKFEGTMVTDDSGNSYELRFNKCSKV